MIIGLSLKSNHISKFSLPKSVKHSVSTVPVEARLYFELCTNTLDQGWATLLTLRATLETSMVSQGLNMSMYNYFKVVVMVKQTFFNLKVFSKSKKAIYKTSNVARGSH